MLVNRVCLLSETCISAPTETSSLSEESHWGIGLLGGVINTHLKLAGTLLQWQTQRHPRQESVSKSMLAHRHKHTQGSRSAGLFGTKPHLNFGDGLDISHTHTVAG